MLALTVALVTGPVMAQAQQKVPRVVPQGEVKVFDPHQSQVNLTSAQWEAGFDGVVGSISGANSISRSTLRWIIVRRISALTKTSKDGT